MSDLSDPYDRHGNRKSSRQQRHDYVTRVCVRCGGDLSTVASRIAHLADQHEDRCKHATPEERLQWRRTRKWPTRCGEFAGASRCYFSIDHSGEHRMFR